MITTPNAARHALAELRDRLIDTPDGVSAATLETAFRVAHPDAEHTLGPHIYAEWLRGAARRTIKHDAPTAQLELPGMEVPIRDVVTTYDAEGGYVYKRVRYATVDDLTNDVAIKAANVDAAQAELTLAVDRNKLLVAVMEAHGFATAGEAIDWLRADG